jgi:hypothetical protein
MTNERLEMEHLRISEAVARALPTLDRREVERITSDKPGVYAPNNYVGGGLKRNSNYASISVDLGEYLSFLESSIRNPIDTARQLESWLSPEAKILMQDRLAQLTECQLHNRRYSSGENGLACPIDKARALCSILTGTSDHACIYWEPRIDLEAFFTRTILPSFEPLGEEITGVPPSLNTVIHKSLTPYKHDPALILRPSEAKRGLIFITSELELPLGSNTELNLRCFSGLKQLLVNLSTINEIDQIIYHPGDDSCFTPIGKIK